MYPSCQQLHADAIYAYPAGCALVPDCLSATSLQQSRGPPRLTASLHCRHHASSAGVGVEDVCGISRRGRSPSICCCASASPGRSSWGAGRVGALRQDVLFGRLPQDAGHVARRHRVVGDGVDGLDQRAIGQVHGAAVDGDGFVHQPVVGLVVVGERGARGGRELVGHGVGQVQRVALRDGVPGRCSRPPRCWPLTAQSR